MASGDVVERVREASEAAKGYDGERIGGLGAQDEVWAGLLDPEDARCASID
jgi:hypothetical protein